MYECLFAAAAYQNASAWARYLKQAWRIGENANSELPGTADPATKPCMENAIWGQLVPRTSLGAFVHTYSWLCMECWFAAAAYQNASAWARYLKQAWRIGENANSELPGTADPATKPCMENAILGQLVPRTPLEASVHTLS